MRAAQYLPPEIKQSFGFKLAAYILPGIIFLLAAILILVPTPQPKDGVLEGKLIGTKAVQILLAQPLDGSPQEHEITSDEAGNYSASLPAGRYQLSLKSTAVASSQLPREITIREEGVTVLDINLSN